MNKWDKKKNCKTCGTNYWPVLLVKTIDKIPGFEVYTEAFQTVGALYPELQIVTKVSVSNGWYNNWGDRKK